MIRITILKHIILMMIRWRTIIRHLKKKITIPKFRHNFDTEHKFLKLPLYYYSLGLRNTKLVTFAVELILYGRRSVDVIRGTVLLASGNLGGSLGKNLLQHQILLWFNCNKFDNVKLVFYFNLIDMWSTFFYYFFRCILYWIQNNRV